ncbi:sulfatase-like hydrolase/transferase [Candidatus Kaiserbacteria bacterium]|nr:sulfatase-like hydrolase/transferase [Candidatus Kaiserbacteria bacterium]
MISRNPQSVKVIYKLCVLSFLLACFFSLHFLATINKLPCEKKCNIILISIDSLGSNYVGTYNENIIESPTPSIDSWAEKSIVFEDYITPSYLTPITEMSLHTSLSPLNSGVVRFDSVLNNKFITLAQVLQSSGYYTVAMGSSPEFFDFSYALRESFSRGFDEYYKEFQVPPIESRTYFRSGRALSNNPLSWIKNPPDDKFFLWLTLGTAHWPYGRYPFSYQQEYNGPLKDENKLDWWDHLRTIYEGNIWSLDELGTTITPLTDEDSRYIKEGYLSNIRATDEFLGKFFKAFKRSVIAENTIVILHSEHGEEMGEHGYYAHYDIYDATIHTPLIIYIPGEKPQRIDSLVNSFDVLPTILDYIQEPPLNQAEGISLRPLIEKSTSSIRNETFSVRVPLWEHAIQTSNGFIQNEESVYQKIQDSLTSFDELDKKDAIFDVAIRTKEWKLIWRKARLQEAQYGWWNLITQRDTIRDLYELYNLKEDPNELRNVYNKEEEVAKELKNKLDIWWEKTQQTRNSEPVIEGTIQPYF